jgi:phosphatidylglycerophosphate synthase
VVDSALNWDEYAIIWARLHGGFDPRHASPAVRGWLRMAYSIAIFLGRLRVRPTVVTVVGALLCVCVPLVATRSMQGPIFAAVFVVLAAVADTVDGAVAVVTRRTSRLGYVYDSVADRFGEASWLAAFWLIGAPGPLVVVAGSLSWLHEYVRARAVGAGMKEIGVVTIGERPSRVAIAAFGLFAAGAGGLLQPDLASGTITVAAVVWVFFAFGGLAQLLGAVRRAMGA